MKQRLKPMMRARQFHSITANASQPMQNPMLCWMLEGRYPLPLRHDNLTTNKLQTILLAQLALQREAVIFFGAIEKTCIYIAMPKFIHRCSLITLAFQIFVWNSNNATSKHETTCRLHNNQLLSFRDKTFLAFDRNNVSTLIMQDTKSQNIINATSFNIF